MMVANASKVTFTMSVSHAMRIERKHKRFVRASRYIALVRRTREECVYMRKWRLGPDTRRRCPCTLYSIESAMGDYTVYITASEAPYAHTQRHSHREHARYNNALEYTRRIELLDRNAVYLRGYFKDCLMWGNEFPF